MSKSTRLIEQLRTLGPKLDTATDPEAMRFLLRGRRAVRAAIEAARPPEPPRSTDADRKAARETKAPEPKTQFQSARESFEQWNARQLNPMPVCPCCKLPTMPQDFGFVLFPDLFSTCETTRIYRYVEMLVKRCGAEAARIKLATLARMQ